MNALTLTNTAARTAKAVVTMIAERRAPGERIQRPAINTMAPVGRVLGVQRPGGLVREQQLLLTRDRPGDAHTLALPSRHAPGKPVAQMRDVDRRQRLLGAVIGLSAAHPADEERKRHVLVGGELGQEIVGLEHHSDVVQPQVGSFPFGFPTQVLPGHDHLSGVRAVDPGEVLRSVVLPDPLAP